VKPCVQCRHSALCFATGKAEYWTLLLRNKCRDDVVDRVLRYYDVKQLNDVEAAAAGIVERIEQAARYVQLVSLWGCPPPALVVDRVEFWREQQKKRSWGTMPEVTLIGLRFEPYYELRAAGQECAGTRIRHVKKVRP